ncbi:retrovirus-related pol polyprotein from transposon TNT 1-94 [Tanacetum coccineum]
MKLTKLINSQISANNKSGVGFNSKMNENELHGYHLNKGEVFKSASDSSVNEIEEENNQVNDRFKKVEGYHAVPLPYTGNYMPSRPDLSFARLDDFFYKTNVSETITSVPRIESTASKSSKDSLKQPKDVRPILTKSGNVPVNTAKQSSPRAAVSNSTARYVNTATSRPIVNSAKPSSNVFHKVIHNMLFKIKGFLIVDALGSMTGNKSFLTYYQDIDGGFVAFARSPKGGKITRKGKIRTGKLDFEDVYFVKELKFNLFLLLDESQVLLKVSRHNNMYSFDQKNIVPSGGIKREFSVARTPQQNRTLIEAARTMLADLLLPTTFWAEVVNTACYVQNRVLVTKPHNKETFLKICTDHARNCGKADEGFLVGYSIMQERINTASENINNSSPNINTASPIPNDSSMQYLENTGIFDDAYDDREVGTEADLNNLETTMNVSPIPTTRIHKDHLIDQIIGDINLATQTRRMTKISKEHVMVSYIKKQRRTNHKDYQNYLFTCFLSQIEPKKVIQALTYPIWIEAMQEELLQFKLQKVWTLVDLPKGKRAIGTKWVYRNKKDERGIVVRNKARLVAQGYTQEEGIDYDEMDVKSAFLYGTIEKEVYVCQPPDDAQEIPDDAQEIPDEFYGGAHFILRIASTIERGWNLHQPRQDEEADNVDVHLYRSMIGSLMYLIASKPDITFAVCACARF